jgi:hypothetical protein
LSARCISAVKKSSPGKPQQRCRVGTADGSQPRAPARRAATRESSAGSALFALLRCNLTTGAMQSTRLDFPLRTTSNIAGVDDPPVDHRPALETATASHSTWTRPAWARERRPPIATAPSGPLHSTHQQQSGNGRTTRPDHPPCSRSE